MTKKIGKKLFVSFLCIIAVIICVVLFPKKLTTFLDRSYQTANECYVLRSGTDVSKGTTLVDRDLKIIIGYLNEILVQYRGLQTNINLEDGENTYYLTLVRRNSNQIVELGNIELDEDGGAYVNGQRYQICFGAEKGLLNMLKEVFRTLEDKGTVLLS